MSQSEDGSPLNNKYMFASRNLKTRTSRKQSELKDGDRKYKQSRDNSPKDDSPKSSPKISPKNGPKQTLPKGGARRLNGSSAAGFLEMHDMHDTDVHDDDEFDETEELAEPLVSELKTTTPQKIIMRFKDYPAGRFNDYFLSRYGHFTQEEFDEICAEQSANTNPNWHDDD